MPNVSDADRQLLDDAEQLPGAMYGSRIYSMTALLALAKQREAFERELERIGTERRERIDSLTALLALAQQREAFERELELIRKEPRDRIGSQGGIRNRSRLPVRWRYRVIIIVALLFAIFTLLLLPRR